MGTALTAAMGEVVDAEPFSSENVSTVPAGKIRAKVCTPDTGAGAARRVV